MNIPITLSLFIPVISTITGITLGWLFGRRKSNVEIDILEIKKLEGSMKLWKDLADDMKKASEQMRQDNQHLLQKIDDLEKQLDLMKKENEKLLRAIKELKKQQSNG